MAIFAAVKAASSRVLTSGSEREKVAHMNRTPRLVIALLALNLLLCRGRCWLACVDLYEPALLVPGRIRGEGTTGRSLGSSAGRVDPVGPAGPVGPERGGGEGALTSFAASSPRLELTGRRLRDEPRRLFD